MEILPKDLFCLTLAHSIDDVDVIEKYLGEYPDDTAAGLPVALRHGLENEGLPEMSVPNPTTTAKYLRIIWSSDTNRKKLHDAASTGSLHLVSYLICRMHPVVQEDMNMIFLDAVRRGYDELVKFLIGSRETAPDFHTRDNRALALAAGGGHISTFKLLLTRGDYKEYDTISTSIFSGKSSPLQYAVDGEQVEMVQYLLSTLEWKPTTLTQALSRAVEKKNIGIARILLSHNAPIRTTHHNWSPSTLIAALNTGNADLCKLIIEHKADVNAEDGIALTLTASGSSRFGSIPGVVGNIAMAKLLIENKANVNTLDPEMGGPSALNYAAMYGNTEAILFLLDAKADIRTGEYSIFKYGGGKSPCVVRAALAGRIDIVKLLLAHGACVDAVVDAYDEIIRYVSQDDAGIDLPDIHKDLDELESLHPTGYFEDRPDCMYPQKRTRRAGKKRR